MNTTRAQTHVAVTAFLALFAIVGLALYGLPFFYDFMVREFGWTRQQVTSGNAYSKLLIGPLFGFMAGWIVDRFGPRRLMLAGIVMAGGALVGLGSITTLPVLPLLPVQRARLRLRRPAAEPGAALALVRQEPRQGDGLRVSRHRRRRRPGAAAGVRADAGVRLAAGAATARAADDRDRAAAGLLRPRATTRISRRSTLLFRRPPVLRWCPSGPSSVSARSICCSSAACARSAPSAARCRT